MAPGSWAQQWVPSNSTRLFLLPRHSVQVRRSSPVAVLVFGLVLQTFLFNQFFWFVFFFYSHDICTFHGCFPSANGDQSEVPIVFLFSLLSVLNKWRAKNIYYTLIYIRLFAAFDVSAVLQDCDLPTPWPQMPPCPLYQVSKTFEPSTYMYNRWSIRQFFLAKSIFLLIMLTQDEQIIQQPVDLTTLTRRSSPYF